MKRIAIVGTTGAGKTTLAKLIAERLGCHCCELDAINWQPNWTELEPDEMVRRVTGVLDKHEGWIVEGNYASVRPLIWTSADTLIWLDYPFPIIFGRLLKRTVKRNVTREDLWSGNRESLKRTLSRQSILLWCMQTYHKRKRQYAECIADPGFSHLRILRFCHPREVERLAERLDAVAVTGGSVDAIEGGRTLILMDKIH